jgi:prepilin-type N-terminal cleavage/methylation domain-containing protein
MLKIMTKNLYKKLKLVSGFTLIELLIVMFILGIVGTVAVSILATTLRGGNKSTNINDVRQNGNYIINQMGKMIAYSQEFKGVSPDNSSDASYVTDCTNPATVYKYIKILSFDGGETIFSCTGNTIASNGASLINTAQMTIPTASCNFYCARSSKVVSPTINVVFTLQLTGNFVENQSTISFETSVTPRNSPPAN